MVAGIILAVGFLKESSPCPNGVACISWTTSFHIEILVPCIPIGLSIFTIKNARPAKMGMSISQKATLFLNQRKNWMLTTPAKAAPVEYERAIGKSKRSPAQLNARTRGAIIAKPIPKAAFKP